jgi:glycosyltransferase involved in cell wall biosynthesis
VAVDLPDSFVLFAGYVCDRKGAYTVAHAARTLLAADRSLHLLYVGALATELGTRADVRIREILGPELSARVQFVGRVDRARVFSIMRRARAFVYPSRLETFGLVVAEAMLAGLPVVASEGEPFPEFVSNEVTGLLVRSDNPTAVADAVRRLLQSPQLSARLSGAARRLAVQRFAVARCVESSERLYAERLESWRGRVARRATSRLWSARDRRAARRRSMDIREVTRERVSGR